jgi:3-dehydroquinate synthase
MSEGTRHAVWQQGTAYDVIVRVGLLGDLPRELDAVAGLRRRVLITDEQILPYIDGWTGGEAPWDAVLTVPAGEAHKTRDAWQRLTDGMLEHGFGRDSAIVAIGGGVIGDLAGFVAATYLRGIPFVQVPTTLLGMVDASVGGKVGVDTPHGKNLVGAFHPPVAVLADPAALWSLPPRTYAAGLAEAVKHGLLADADYFSWMQDNAEPIRTRDLAALETLVGRSVAIKSAVVQRDPLEQGERATLNLGHTVGHAIEHVVGYRLLHGECVSIGLIVACRVAEQTQGLDPAVSAAVRTLLERFALPVRVPADADTPALLAAMRQDKKNRGGIIRMVLPARVGATQQEQGSWTIPCSSETLVTAIDASR